MFRLPKTRTLWMIILTLTALVVWFAPDADAAGKRLVVDVGEPFEIQGRVHPAGVMTIRHMSDFSPVATLNELCTDTGCVMLIARESTDRRQALRDELIFERSERGHLVLVGVAFDGEPLREVPPGASAAPTTIAWNRTDR